MPSSQLNSLITTFLAVLLAALPAASDELDQKVQSVLPQANERVWSEIPWLLDLQHARRQSQNTGKPIFVWIMDGHVMAAT